MAITFGTQNNAPTNAAAGGKAKKPQAKAWVNVGYEEVDPETGETVFIGLPMGIPLDTMELRSAGGSKIMQAKNAFHEALTAAVLSMEPGQEEIVLDLKVQVRRVLDREAANGENNAFIGGLEKLSFAQKKSA